MRKTDPGKRFTGVICTAVLTAVLLTSGCGMFAQHNADAVQPVQTTRTAAPGSMAQNPGSKAASEKKGQTGAADSIRIGEKAETGSTENAAAAADAATQPDTVVRIVGGGSKTADTGTAAAATAAGTDGTETIRLCFAGDILLSDHVLNAYDSGKGIGGILDQKLLDTGRNADLFMANEEFPFGTTGTPAKDKQFTFRMDPRRCGIFKELGLDIVTLANNHALDYGRDALQETFAALDQNGIRYVGAGKNLERAKEPQFFTVKGKKIGFLAASRVIPDGSWGASDQSGMFLTYDPAQLVRQITETRKQCDFLVVYVHWGLERHTEPESYQVQLAQQYIDAGASLVVGSHPHVLQKIDFYKGTPIAYSLGNYLFGSAIPSTELLLCDIAPDNSVRISIIPAKGSAGKTVSAGEETEVSRNP